MWAWDIVDVYNVRFNDCFQSLIDLEADHKILFPSEHAFYNKTSKFWRHISTHVRTRRDMNITVNKIDCQRDGPDHFFQCQLWLMVATSWKFKSLTTSADRKLFFVNICTLKISSKRCANIQKNVKLLYDFMSELNYKFVDTRIYSNIYKKSRDVDGFRKNCWHSHIHTAAAKTAGPALDVIGNWANPNLSLACSMWFRARDTLSNLTMKHCEFNDFGLVNSKSNDEIKMCDHEWQSKNVRYALSAVVADCLATLIASWDTSVANCAG